MSVTPYDAYFPHDPSIYKSSSDAAKLYQARCRICGTRAGIGVDASQYSLKLEYTKTFFGVLFLCRECDQRVYSKLN